MAQESVNLGTATTIKAGVSYSLPSRLVRIQSSGAVTTSLDGTTFTALTGAETTGAETAAMFIKAAADTLVVCKGF